MNKIIIITIIVASGILGYIIKKDKTKVEYALDNVQCIKGWVYEDLNDGVIDSTYAAYYLQALNQTEDLLIEVTN